MNQFLFPFGLRFKAKSYHFANPNLYHVGQGGDTQMH